MVQYLLWKLFHIESAIESAQEKIEERMNSLEDFGTHQVGWFYLFHAPYCLAYPRLTSDRRGETSIILQEEASKSQPRRQEARIGRQERRISFRRESEIPRLRTCDFCNDQTDQHIQITSLAA